MQNDLDNLQIRCRNYHAGCNEVVTVIQIEKHESKCEYVTVQCPNSGCNQRLEKRSLQQHLPLCHFQMHSCPKGCGLAILTSEDKRHNCVAELRMSLEFLRSELICKVQEQAKEAEIMMESQKRIWLRRENVLIGQVEDLRDQVTRLSEQLKIMSEKIIQRDKEIQEITMEKRKMLDQGQKYINNKNCRQCSRKERIKLI